MFRSNFATKLVICAIITVFSGTSFSQTLYSERNKLTALEQEQRELKSTNVDIEQNLKAISDEINIAKANAPSGEAYEAAKSNLAATTANAEAVASSENLAKVDNAKFKLVLAERKYKRGNRELFDLEKEQKRLQYTVKSNNARSTSIDGQLESLTAIIASLKASKARNARVAAEAKTKKQQADSEQEIARLRAMLAQREAEAAKAAKAELAKQAASEAAAIAEAKAEVKAAAAIMTSESITQTVGSSSTPAPKEYKQVITVQNADDAVKALANFESLRAAKGKKGRSSKIISIKNYRNKKLVNQSSKSLRHKGNMQYNARAQIRSGEVTFVIGNKRLSGSVESQHDKDVYMVLLDARDMATATMTLVPTRLVP